jgi:hypothetical protein
MKAIKYTNLKMLTILAALLLLTASLAIPIQESSAEKEKKGKDYDGEKEKKGKDYDGEKEKKGKDYDGEKEKNYDSIKQMNECSDSVIACINIICQAAEVCIIPQDSFTRIALPI